MFLAFKTMICNPTTKRKMFEAECNSSIQKFEKISFGSLVVTEHIFIRTHKPRHSQSELRILVYIIGKEQYRPIGWHAILKQLPF